MQGNRCQQVHGATLQDSLIGNLFKRYRIVLFGLKTEESGLTKRRTTVNRHKLSCHIGRALVTEEVNYPGDVVWLC